MERIITCNLTENFIERLTDFLDENFLSKGKDISKLAIVFGGKRPALFLKKELSKKIKRGYLSPRFFSIDEFVEYIVSKKEMFLKISDLDACFTIYKLAQNLAKEILKDRDSFSKFLPWAREIYFFIEQLDLEDVKIKSLENIQFKARIGFDVPENINVLLSHIISLREAYHLSLKVKKAYSRGLIYLLSSDYVQDLDFSEFNFILFCGFFYLYKTEVQIIKHLYNINKALLLFQGDKSNWSVFKKYLKDFSFPIRPNLNPAPDFKLFIQAGFDVHSEACLIREIVKKINPALPTKESASEFGKGGVKNLDKTVLVLPSPENLIPLLSEISKFVDDFNVSMGYPLKRSSLYWLFSSIFKAQETKKSDAYYSKDYLRVLNHPLIKNLKIISDNPSITRVLVHKIEEIMVGIEKTSLSGSLFVKLKDLENSRELFDVTLSTMKTMEIEVTYEELKSLLKELHNLLFILWEDISNFYEFSLSLEKFLEFLLNFSFLGKYPLNLKMIEKVFTIKEELNNLSFNKEPFPKEDIFKIFDNKITYELISFSGSPLKGLQILGLFETRSLNFDNVIIMDVNESVLPALKIYEPLIPREVMIGLGINRLEKEEEIQHYHFQRLVSGAKNVYLIYQKRQDLEKSRFIEGLVWEKQKESNSLEVLDSALANFKVRVLAKKLEIKKDPTVIKFLKDQMEYSSSSINMYMQCPLRFYYQYVLALQEKEDLLDEPQERDMGNFIHQLLKETFSKFIGRSPYIDDKFEKEFSHTLDKKFAEEFEKKMKSDSFLTKGILRFRLEKFLENEKKRNVCKIICLEKTFLTKIKLKDADLKFKAIIDRIDELKAGEILVIDYKTGSTDILPQAVEKIESRGFTRPALKNTLKSFQLPLYLYFMDNDERFKNARINACLYSLRDVSKNSGLNLLFKKEEQLTNREKTMVVYLKALESILGEILNPDIPFQADEEEPNLCSSCPFFYLCR
jgi:CRISPR/Cas system-associated exonuclease Cas4 (RecB family)